MEPTDHECEHTTFEEARACCCTFGLTDAQVLDNLGMEASVTVNRASSLADFVYSLPEDLKRGLRKTRVMEKSSRSSR